MHFEPGGSVWLVAERLGGKACATGLWLWGGVGSRHPSRFPGRLRGWWSSRRHNGGGTQSSPELVSTGTGEWQQRHAGKG
jgi:hypothetical protein